MAAKRIKEHSGINSGLISEHESHDKVSEPSKDEVTSSEKESLSFLETLQSVAWAMLGVQSKKNAKRDFKKGKPSHFIVIGIIFATVFVLTLVSIIQILLNHVD